ncbi:MAG: WG repeat-containing protein [Phaeodactylibacter sp.]|nr:WG repeat-containing protein [Phaeodactylibacter sp.]
MGKSKFLYCLLILLSPAFSCAPKGADATKEPEALSSGKNGEADAPVEEEAYIPVFSDGSKDYTIVLKPGIGFVALDKKGEALYEVFPYDNGPDYPADGYFRIVDNGKIGYADEETGQTMIQPQYAAARPFENGYAPVCPDCETQTDGEYSSWVNGKWGLIDKRGRVVVEPQFEEILEVTEDGRVLVVAGGKQRWEKIK